MARKGRDERAQPYGRGCPAVRIHAILGVRSCNAAQDLFDEQHFLRSQRGSALTWMSAVVDAADVRSANLAGFRKTGQCESTNGGFAATKLAEAQSAPMAASGKSGCRLRVAWRPPGVATQWPLANSNCPSCLQVSNVHHQGPELFRLRAVMTTNSARYRSLTTRSKLLQAAPGRWSAWS